MISKSEAAGRLEDTAQSQPSDAPKSAVTERHADWMARLMAWFRPTEAEGWAVAEPPPKVDQEAEWRAEFNRNMAEAVAAVPKPAGQYSIWQAPDGWWRVGKWSISTYPQYYRQFDYWPRSGARFKPATTVSAYGSYEPYAPTHKTEREARKWLADLISPPPAKVYTFNAKGQEVPPRKRKARTPKPPREEP